MRTTHRSGLGALVAALALTLAAPGLAAAAEGGGDAADKARARAQRDYNKAVRLTRSGRAGAALELYERALPHMNYSSDIFYNLVHVCDAAKRWDKVVKYAQGFMHLEPGSGDAKEISSKMRAALKRLERTGRVPVAVVFDVTPERTEVFVDQVPVASNKVTEVLLFPGEHVARAEKLEHHPWEQRFVVEHGKPQTIKGALEKKVYMGSLKIVTDPPEGVEVFIDDELVGVTPLEPLKLRTLKYLVRFDKPGYDRWIRYVTIDKDQEYELKPVLERTRAPKP